MLQFKQLRLKRIRVILSQSLYNELSRQRNDLRVRHAHFVRDYRELMSGAELNYRS